MGLHALPVSLACGSLALGSVGSVVGLMATFKRNYAKEDLLGLLLPVPRPCGQALPAHASTGGLPTLAGSFGSVSCGVTAPLLWSWCVYNFVCASKTGVCFLQSCGSPIIKSCWASQTDSLGILSPFVGSPGWESDVGFRTFTTVVELLWYYCSPVCGSPTPRVWGLILL